MGFFTREDRGTRKEWHVYTSHLLSIMFEHIGTSCHNSLIGVTPHYISEMFEIEERLKNKGITIDAIVEAAMGLYVSHGIPEEQASMNIKAKIQKYLQDPNVSSLLLGAVLLEEELYEKRKNSEIAEDPVFLLSDEIIGMAIAECIGGTYARFEFTRYDQKKPGILATLGPFLDDAVAGLIAGCTSRLYSECV
jgi:alpha-ribazole phosphatase CobZ